MGSTNKAIFYKKCCQLCNDDQLKIYKTIYHKTTLDFWVREFKHYGKIVLYKTELIKIYLGCRVPLEIYFIIMGYLNLNNLI